MRSLPAVVAVVLSSGCAWHHARIEPSRELVFTRQGDALCGPIGIRRSSLGARWGEYVRVTVSSPAVVTGEARLHVDGRAAPLQRFTTAPTLDVPVPVAVAANVGVGGAGVSVEVSPVVPLPSGPAIVLDAAWTNERLDVSSALGAGHVIDITLAELTTSSGSCAEVVFTVEQGVFQPNVDERVWVAELTRRGGPELQAWLVAEEQRKEAIRQAHFVEAERRKVEWQLQVAARREQLRLEAEQQAIAIEVQAQLAVEAKVAEAQRKEEIRQAHFAEWKQRRSAGNAASVQVPVEAPPKERVLVCREPIVNQGSLSTGVGMRSTRVPPVVSDGCESVEVAQTDATIAAEVSGSAGVELSDSASRRTDVRVVGASETASVEPGARGADGRVDVATTTNVRVSTGVTGAVSGVALESRATSTEQVSAAPAMEVSAWPAPAAEASVEWQTPRFETQRVAVSREQVAPPPCGSCGQPVPPPPPCGGCQPSQVTVVQPDPVAVGLLHFFGALINVAASAPPPPRPVHQAAPVQVHSAQPVNVPVPPPPPR